MNTLAESPGTILAVGALALTVSVVLYVALKRKETLGIIAFVLLLTALLFWYERSVTTPREAVTATVYELAGALETNRLSEVLRFLAQDATALRQEAQDRLPQVTIREAKVKPNLQVRVDPQNDTVAEAVFNAVIVAEDVRTALGTRRLPQRFTLKFVHEAGGWKVVEYQRENPIGRR